MQQEDTLDELLKYTEMLDIMIIMEIIRKSHFGR